MISVSRSSVYSKDQESRLAFCCISSADVATPPALAALPGAKRIPASWNSATASGVVGMLAPSATASRPLRDQACGLVAVELVLRGARQRDGASTSQTRRRRR